MCATQRKPPVQLDQAPAPKHYQGEAASRALQVCQRRLSHLHQACFLQARRVLIVLEGWDAAGKGGTIRRLTSMLDPRGVRVHSYGPPGATEQGRHYLYRFWRNLPPPGCWAVFDRSYYGRVLVERVSSLANEHAWQRAYHEIQHTERMWVDDGLILIKLFLHISADEQAARFAARLADPHKRWKLTEADFYHRRQRADYQLAIDDMFSRTDTPVCPWHIVACDHKPSARIAALTYLADQLATYIDPTPPPMDPKVFALARVDLKDNPKP